MFYGKATSTGYTNFKIGFYPRVIVYNYVRNDNPLDGISFGLQFNSKLDTELCLWAITSSGMSLFGAYIKFYESSVNIKIYNSETSAYFVIFG